MELTISYDVQCTKSMMSVEQRILKIFLCPDGLLSLDLVKSKSIRIIGSLGRTRQRLK